MVVKNKVLAVAVKCNASYNEIRMIALLILHEMKANLSHVHSYKFLPCQARAIRPTLTMAIASHTQGRHPF